MNIELLAEWSLQHSKASALHLIKHWYNVSRYGDILCNMAYPKECPNRKVVECFAYLHDSCRISDDGDIHHGERAAEKITEIRDSLLAELTDEEFELLQTACRLHTLADTHDDIIVQICMDADRLDLDRVGVVPDPERMASKYGAEYATIHHGKYERRAAIVRNKVSEWMWSHTKEEYPWSDEDVELGV